MLTGEISYFVNSENIILPFELYKKFQMRSVRGLLRIQFLPALNIYLSGSAKDSKDAMSEFFHNLSLQALSIEDDRIHITFEATNKIDEIITDNLSILKFEFMKDETERSFEDDENISRYHCSSGNVHKCYETGVVQAILKDEKPTFPDNNKSHNFSTNS